MDEAKTARRLPKRRSAPSKEQTKRQAELPASEPEKREKAVVIPEAPPDLSPFLDAPVEIELVEGASYRDHDAKVLFIKGRPLPVNNRRLVELCRRSSRFRVGG